MESQSHPMFVILSLIGALLVLIGIFLLIRTLRFIALSRKTTGTVIDLEETDNEGVTYSPIVRFSADGEERVFTDSISTNPAMFDLGDEVTVFYSPDDPRKAKIGTTFRLHLVSIVLFGIGAIFLAVGGWGLGVFG